MSVEHQLISYYTENGQDEKAKLLLNSMDELHINTLQAN